ncbi:hypothetical protein C8F04DRAFT_893187, partial [Mycena alexandri]
PTSAPYGTWRSPISSSMIARMSVSTEDVLVDPVNSKLHYIQKRPAKNGQNVIVGVADGLDVFGREWNARTAVHEYGGAPAVVHNNIVLFSNLSDGQVYKVDLLNGSTPSRITHKDKYRFADFTCHPRAPNIVVCILEDHTNAAPEDVVNSLVYFNIQSSVDPVTLISGSDFYSTPRFNSDGSLLAWTEWAHPDMPWDGSVEQVFIAAVDIKEANLHLAPFRLPRSRVAGRPSAISAVQPTWFNGNKLLFACDISGYHNPWITTVNEDTQTTHTFQSRALLADQLALDFADPSWWLGGSNIAVLDDSAALFAASRDGRTIFYVVSANGGHSEIPCP